MRQLAQYQDGRLELQEVPVPRPPPGGILVRVACSVVSPGTERMKVEQARMSLLEKARARPDQARQVIDTARTLGWKAAYEKVRNRLESPAPLGYSAAGVVVEVDPANRRFQVGDRVACGGAECAHHAEFIAVPDLLAAPTPEGVEDWQAAYTTLGSIALQAVRQAKPRLGDRVLVLGQGLIGLLVTRLLHLSGARVLGVDLQAKRLEIATQLGAEQVVRPVESSLARHVSEWTDGLGADAVLICAGGNDPRLTETALASLRDRGLLVVVGIHDLDLPWREAAMKDIQVRYARSYGPGRYDPSYEWGGHDYPAGYVRWTENRNFEACLHLMQSGALDLAPLTTRRVPFAEAVAVYEDLLRPGNPDIGVVLAYGGDGEWKRGDGRLEIEGEDRTKGSTVEAAISPSPISHLPSSARPASLHVLGAGNFARTMLLPHLRGRIAFGTVVNGSGLSARHVREKFGFAQAETDPETAFGDPSAALLIAARHHLHAPYVLRGLAANQQVFVEKPLCLTEEELAEIDAAMATTRGSLMVGFNRRFAPATVVALQALDRAPGPRAVTCEVHAGPLSKGHWYGNLDESGGRVLGEACHFFDLFCHLIPSPPVRVTAQPIGHRNNPDNLSAQVAFADGSTAQLLYTTAGDPAYPKETWRVFAAGLVLDCENFQRLDLFTGRKRRRQRFTSKGHAEEMAAWSDFLASKGPHPLPYAAARRSMALTFAAVRAARDNHPISLDPS